MSYLVTEKLRTEFAKKKSNNNDISAEMQITYRTNLLCFRLYTTKLS